MMCPINSYQIKDKEVERVQLRLITLYVSVLNYMLKKTKFNILSHKSYIFTHNAAAVIANFSGLVGNFFVMFL